jgi:hypothetical protein
LSSNIFSFIFSIIFFFLLFSTPVIPNKSKIIILERTQKNFLTQSDRQNMGAELSCDICKKTLSEDNDIVHECKGAELNHICVQCFNPNVHTNYTARTVYAVCGEENARRMNQGLQNGDPNIESTMQIIANGFSDCVSCPCGMQNVRREGVTSCFACGRAFEA